MRPMRAVSPYRPFAPESLAHQELGPFDWVGAIEMLRTSVTQSNACETVVITDVDTEVSGPTFHYRTVERRLMLWILEVAHCYVHSDDFDCDTVMLSPDLLVFGSLREWMSDYFTVLMRTRYPGHPILNAVQFWPVTRKKTLQAFYAQALAIGRALPERYLRWGGDTEPLCQLLAPLAPGLVMREGKPLARLIESNEVLQAFTSEMGAAMERGVAVPPVRPIVDFRFLRKRFMKSYFDATIGREVAA